MKRAKCRRSDAQWRSHLEQARREGKSLGAYARAHGIAEQSLYAARQRLRDRGEVALSARAARAPLTFVALPAAPARAAAVCRMQIGMVTLDCLAWPPAAWLRSLQDDAP